MTERVYVHIGAYKTGTTYLQQRLWANRDGLAASGVLFPGWKGWGDQVRAFKHVLEREQLRGGPVPAQPWTRVIEAIRDWDGAVAILSYEGVSLANEAQVGRIVADLAPAEVHMIVTARDLVRVIPAMWQEVLQGGQTWTWPQYVGTVTGALGRTVPPGRAFWRAHDLVRVTRPWADAVGAGRVHVVTVPPAGSPPELLWERFSAAAGIDPTAAPIEPARINESLDPASTELMRRINLVIEGRMDLDIYDRMLKGFVAKEVLAATASSERITLNADRAEWARERGRSMGADLARQGYDVVGDLDDLVGSVPAGIVGSPTTEQTLEVAIRVIEALVRRPAGRGVGGGGGGGRPGRPPEDGGPDADVEPPKVGSKPASRLVRQAYERLRR